LLIINCWGWAVPSSGPPVARYSSRKNLRANILQSVIFNLKRNWCGLQFQKILMFSSFGKLFSIVGQFSISYLLMLSSIFQKIKSSSIVKIWGKIWGGLPFSKNWGCLPFAKTIKVVFQYESYHSCMVTWSSFTHFHLFHYISGWVGLAKLKLNSASLVELGCGLSLAINFFFL
jgi:hypothetical protein